MNFVKTGKYFFGFNIMINISFKEAHSGLFKLPIRYTCFLGGVGEQVDFVTCSLMQLASGHMNSFYIIVNTRHQ